MRQNRQRRIDTLLIHNVMIVLQPTGERDNRFMIPLRHSGDANRRLARKYFGCPADLLNHRIIFNRLLSSCSVSTTISTPARNSARATLKARRPFHLPRPRREHQSPHVRSLINMPFGFPAPRRCFHHFRCRPFVGKMADAPQGTTAVVDITRHGWHRYLTRSNG